MKRIAYWLTLGLLLSLFLLTGCAMFEQKDMPESVALPEPPVASMDAPNTDSVPLRSLEVELYMRSADGGMLIPVSHRMSVAFTEDAALALMQALVNASEEGLINSIPAGTRVVNVEHSNNMVTVDLSIDAYNVSSADDLLWMDAAIANTLGSLEDVEYVNVLIGGRKYSLDGMSMGAMPAGEANPTMLWAHSRTELEYIERADSAFELERTAMVYYPAVSGGRLLPAAVPVQYTEDRSVDALMQALTNLPEGISGVHAAFEEMPAYTSAAVVTEDGRRVLMIDLTADTWAAMQQTDADMACAAAMMTIVSFVPELDGVAFCADGMLITEYTLDGEVYRPEMGIMTREGLRSRIGMAMDLYFANAQGDGLRRVTRIVSPLVEHYPRMLLSMLMEGPVSSEMAVSAVPEGITTEDVLGISLNGRVMQVNLSANFYRLTQSMDGDAERRMVYSMVNTLCNLDSVGAVQFFVESAQVEAISGEMYLMVPLMPNPGMAAEAIAENAPTEGE